MTAERTENMTTQGISISSRAAPTHIAEIRIPKNQMTQPTSPIITARAHRMMSAKTGTSLGFISPSTTLSKNSSIFIGFTSSFIPASIVGFRIKHRELFAVDGNVLLVQDIETVHLFHTRGQSIIPESDFSQKYYRTLPQICGLSYL